mmetsp:Transcript_34274/g.72965  ORF Transcript_34274/g.72965 Transcript_34274/m.72965 type:complete len:315 (+) Transcript_34274:64-1008(+)
MDGKFGGPLPRYYGSHGTSGSRGAQPKILRLNESAKRSTLNMSIVLLSLLVPWALFAVDLCFVALPLHVELPGLMWVVVVVSILATLGMGVSALEARRAKNGESAFWRCFLFVSMLLAFILAIVCGTVVFMRYTEPYQELGSLNTYSDVDPAKLRGDQLLDAGRITFSEGTRLDISKSMGFKQDGTYCVAPIVTGDASLKGYDFWAVGKGCCSGGKADFACAKETGHGVHGGLRLMEDEDRPFFRLAVQQAEAIHKIRSRYPLFFKWTRDPAEELNSWRVNSVNVYLLGIFAFAVWQGFLVACATLIASKRAGC